MLRCASPFVIAAYVYVRLIPHDSRALPADFLQSRPRFNTLSIFTSLSCLMGRHGFLLHIGDGKFIEGKKNDSQGDDNADGEEMIDNGKCQGF
jgi:hypothetical protein